MATMQLYKRDEITRWLDGRYVSASEASWRIFYFDTHDQHPSIIRLQVHLPGQHMVLFDPDEHADDVLQRAASAPLTGRVIYQ